MSEPRLTPAQLDEIERFARADLTGNIGQQAAARRQLALAEEVRRLWNLFARLYHAIPEVIGTEELQAELEREAARLSVIRPGKPDVH